MIEIGSASSGNNTGSVVLESSLIGFDGDRDWTLLKSILKSIDAILWDIFIAGNTSGSFGSRVKAGTFNSFVRVISRSLEWVVDNVFKGSVHKTTLACTVLSRAINKLLLGIVNECVTGNSSSGGDTSRGGERPAGTALSLVLDWSNHSFLNPIDTVGRWSWSNKRVIGGGSW